MVDFSHLPYLPAVHPLAPSIAWLTSPIAVLKFCSSAELFLIISVFLSLGWFLYNARSAMALIANVLLFKAQYILEISNWSVSGSDFVDSREVELGQEVFSQSVSR